MPRFGDCSKPCVDCGAPVGGYKWAHGRKTCTDCGIRRAVTAALDMSHHDGIAWARWQRSNARGAKGATADRKER